MTRVRNQLSRWVAALLLLVGLGAAAIASAPAAFAHPLGNFTVNYSSGLVVEPGAVRIDQVVDRAEIPTLQAFPDARPGQDPAGAVQFRSAQCAALAEGARLSIAGRPAALQVVASRLELLPGAAGLAISRLECTLRTVSSVRTVGNTVDFQAAPSDGRVGWHEVTARGDGVRLAGSDVPSISPSGQLRQYPADLLASPLNQRSARFEVTAGTGVVSGEQADGSTDKGVLYGLDRVTTAYTALVSRATLTPAFALLAVVLSILLGALHAFAPGHGKTLMAAYLVGREGTWRQAAVIGMSVTLTHTVGVLLLGAALSAAVLAAPESVYPWLGLISGLMLAAIGVTLLRSPARLLAGHAHSSDDGTGHGHGQPWAERPGRVILVGNDKMQFGHMTIFSPLHGFRKIAKCQSSHKDKTCSQYNEHNADFKIGKGHGENHRRNEIGEIDIGAVNGGHALAFVGAHRPQKRNAADPIEA